MGCHYYIDPTLFDPDSENEVIHLIRSDPSLSQEEKKTLITCWFQSVYGAPSDLPPGHNPAGDAMSAYLQRAGFPSFEALLQHSPKS